MNFKNFRKPFCDDVLNRDDPYLWSNLKLKFKAKDLWLAFLTFWNLLVVKCSLENNQTKHDSRSPSESVVVSGNFEKKHQSSLKFSYINFRTFIFFVIIIFTLIRVILRDLYHMFVLKNTFDLIFLKDIIFGFFI